MNSIRVLLAVPSVLLCLGTGEVGAQVTFRDCAGETGTRHPGFGRGSAMVDLDGDGLLDIIAGNDGLPNGFLRQLPDHTFESVNADWGIADDDRATYGVLVADFDNDGDPDVYFINGGFEGIQANQLLRNALDTAGVFTDVSDFAGDAAVPAQNFGGTALDYDRDGDLDIFLTVVRQPGVGQPCMLLRNDLDLIFSDVSSAAGLLETGDYRHCSSGDLDNDGWIDVAVGNEGGPNRLYRNNRDGTFADVAAFAGVESPRDNFGLVLEDFDNDGWMDVYVPKYQPYPTGPSQLFRNNRDGTFTNVTAGSGMTGQTDMGHNTGDLDGDGYPDIFIGTGNPSFADYDVLFLITPDGAGGLLATDVSDSSGITSNGPTRGHGAPFGDYNQDGFIDLFVNNGGVPSLPETIEPSFLWQNQGNDNRWTALRLIGVVSNRTAVGTRSVAVTSSGREVHRYLDVGSGFANTDSPVQHYAIGLEAEVDRIEISWPSGNRQTVLGPPMGRITDVTECVVPGYLNPGDAEQDGDLDLADFSLFQTCIGAGDGSRDLRCVLFDFSADCDVHVEDIAGFVAALTGPVP